MFKKNKKRRSGFLFNFGIGEEKTFFIENLAILINSGVGILSALEVMRSEFKTERMKTVVGELIEDVNDGLPLYKALGNANILSQSYLSLIKIGEKSGRLSENLSIIATEQQKNRILKSKIKSALTYPALVITVTLFVGIGVAWFVLPKLALVFSQLRLKLPLITKIFIGIGEFLASYGAIVVPLFILLFIVAIYIFFLSPKTKYLGQTFLLRLPGTKKLIRELEIARFGFVLGTLLKAGLSVVDSLDSLIESTNYPLHQKFYIHLRDSFEEGNSFQKSFSSYHGSSHFIPTSIQQIIFVGEQSGNLSGSLIKISEIFEARAEITVKNLSVIIEPVLLVIVWLGVLSVALAVIIPLYGVLDGIH